MNARMLRAMSQDSATREILVRDAAPELLAALRLMLEGTDEDCGRIRCPHKSAVAAAFAAIAKAEGRA